MIEDFFQRTKKEILKLDNEFEQMSKENHIHLTKISRSIQEKSEQFNIRKQERKRIFDSIRNK